MSVVFMFSGQGGQYYGMGEVLYRSSNEFRAMMERLDGVARSINGESILAQLYEPSVRLTSEFDQLCYTHPAIFMLEYSLAHTLMSNGVKPSILLGSSLGEVVSAAISKSIDAEAAMDFVVRQAGIFEKYAEPGGMMAVLASPDIFYEWKLAEQWLEIAAVNYSEHIVLSGGREQLNWLESELRNRAGKSRVGVKKGGGYAFMRLPVTQGFHSSKIDSAKKAFLELSKGYVFRSPDIPVISGTTGLLMEHIDGEYLWNVVRNQIRFPLSIDTARKLGGRDFYDLGPSGTLANFAKRCLHTGDYSCEALLSPFVPNLDVFNRLIRKNSQPELGGFDMSNTGTALDSSSTVFMFPGQGSQSVGMGKDLFDKYPELVSKADQILGYSIKDLCLNGPEEKLGNTQFTQPALYVVSALSYLETIKTEPEPSIVMGHSLGEFNALFAAGVFGFEEGLKLVKKRGELMASASVESNGGMIAVINSDQKKIQLSMDTCNIRDVDFANYNSPSQIVMAGPASSLDKLTVVLKEAGAMVIPLKVSAPFHSRYMEQTQNMFLQYLQGFTFSDPNKIVISNVYAQPYPSEHVKSCMAKQISSPVRWSDSIQNLLYQGVSNFREVGHGNVLKGLLTKIQQATPARSASKSSAANTPLKALIDEVNSVQSKTAHKSESNAADSKVSIESDNSSPVVMTAETLGSSRFRQRYGLKYAYATGAMYKGIASKELVIRMTNAGFLSFFGTGGLSDEVIGNAIDEIQRAVPASASIGMNLVCNLANPDKEMRTVQLFLEKGITVIEAAAFLSITPALVFYRLKGLSRSRQGEIIAANRIVAKVSRPEVAQQFLKPAPAHIVKKLLEKGLLTSEQADLATSIPMADSMCVEADSGGHTDMGVLSVILPSIIRLKDSISRELNYANVIDVGAAGGIGTPESAASALLLGADFIVTGSINQCSPEAGTSDAVKDLLQDANVHDTRYAPAGDMFEIGAKVQVLKKGVFFPSRANKLYELWQRYNAWEEIDQKTRDLIQKKYFKRTFDEVYQETRDYYNKVKPQEIIKAEKDSKHKMALVFRWYFVHTNRIAINGLSEKVDYQIHCGPSLGAFNQWVKGTKYESWRNRHVDDIALHLLNGTAIYFLERYKQLFQESEAAQLSVNNPLKSEVMSV